MTANVLIVDDRPAARAGWPRGLSASLAWKSVAKQMGSPVRSRVSAEEEMVGVMQVLCDCAENVSIGYNLHLFAVKSVGLKNATCRNTFVGNGLTSPHESVRRLRARLRFAFRPPP